MAISEIFFSKNEVFFSDFSVNKSSKNLNSYIILGLTVAISVPNVHLKFRKDRSSSFGEKINTAWKKVVSRKTCLKFFSEKSRKNIVLTANQWCRHHTGSTLLQFFEVDFFNRFLELDKVGWSLKSNEY